MNANDSWVSRPFAVESLTRRTTEDRERNTPQTLCAPRYSKFKKKKISGFLKNPAPASSHFYMKKLLLLAAVLAGATFTSRAGGVHFSFGFGLPLPLPPPVIVSRPAPVVVAPPV